MINYIINDGDAELGYVQCRHGLMVVFRDQLSSQYQEPQYSFVFFLFFEKVVDLYFLQLVTKERNKMNTQQNINLVFFYLREYNIVCSSSLMLISIGS